MRIAYLDLTRALAILMVVGIHAWDTFVLPSTLVSTLTGWSLHQAVHTVGRYGVPLFVMLTGALMLGRDYPNMKSFFLAKIPRFLGALVVAFAVYALLVKFLFDTNSGSVISKLLNGQPVGGYHLWYMYMLTGLYLSLPFLARLLRALSEAEVRYLLLLSLAAVILPWTLNAADTGFSYLSSYSFLLPTYLAYAVAGYWLHVHRGLQAISLIVRWAALAALLGLTVLIKIVIDYVPDSGVPSDGITWYDSVLIFLPSCLLFSLLRDMTAGDYRPGIVVRTLAASSFSIYLWHLAAVHLGEYLGRFATVGPFLSILITGSVGIGIGICLYTALRLTRLNWLVR